MRADSVEATELEPIEQEEQHETKTHKLFG